MRRLLLLLLSVFPFCIALGQEVVDVCNNSNYTLSAPESNCSKLWLSKSHSAATWDTIVNWSSQFSYTFTNITSHIDVQCKGDLDADGQADTLLLYVTLNPLSDLVAGTITSSSNLCYGDMASVSFSAAPSGAGGGYTYRWLQSSNSLFYLGIQDADSTSTTYTSGPLYDTVWYQVKVVSGIGCQAFTNVVKVCVADSLTPATISTTQLTPICYGAVPDSIVVSTPARGGYGFTYGQWQQKTPGSSWVSIPGASSPVYQPAALTETTEYRYLTNCVACGTVYSNVITIQVLPQMSAGTLPAELSICNHTAATISFSTLPTGGGDGYTYQWYTSANNNSFSPLLGANNATLTTTQLDTNRFYFVTVRSSQGCSATTNTTEVVVFRPFVAGAISGGSTVCHDDTPSPLTLLSGCSGGNTPYTFQWQESTNGTDYSDIQGATSSSYQQNLTNPTQFADEVRNYRLAFTSANGCGTVYSNVEQITILADLSPAVISSTTTNTICNGTVPTSISITSNPQGGHNSFSHQWQVLQSGQWVDIPSATNTSYQPSALTETTQYRVKSTDLCGEAFSQPYTINVYPTISAGQLASEQKVCYQSDFQIQPTTIPTGGGDSYTYQWLESTDGASYSPIIGAISGTYHGSPISTSRYMKLAVVSSLGCSDTTNIIHVVPLDQFMPGTISGIDTICHGTHSTAIAMSNNCSGGSTPYSYQWQKSENGVDWSNIAGQTGSQCNTGDLTTTSQIRLMFISNNSCGEVYSSPAEVFVMPEIIPATISAMNTTPICYDSVPSFVSITQQPYGVNGTFANQWQMNNGNGWEDIIGQTSNTFQPSNLRSTTQYRVASTSSLGCPVVNSTPVAISVYGKINAGHLADQNICHQTATTINFIQQPSGGGDLYQYRWEESSDSTNFTEIVGINTNYYNRAVVNDDRYYRVIVTSILGCSLDTSNISKVHVYPLFERGSIGGVDTICNNTTPNFLATTSDCQGGLEPYSYQWQFSTDGMNFSNIPSGNSQSYQPGQLSQSTYYRLLFTSSGACGSLYSDTVRIHVYNPLVKAVVSSNNTSTLCFDSIPQQLYLQTHPSGGNGLFTHQWQKNNGMGWSNISGATGTFYQPQHLRDTVSYRIISTSSFGCGSVTSDPVTINVYQRIGSGLIGDPDTICYGANDTLYFTQMPTGGGGIYSYKWQTSTDNITYTDASVNSTTYLRAEGLMETSYYRVIVYSQLGCSSDTTNSVHISVRPDFIAPVLDQNSDSVCYGYKPQYVLSILENCSGGATPYSYQWQRSENGNDFFDIPGSVSETLGLDTMFNTTYYRIVGKSSAGCGTRISNVHEVRVNPLPIPHKIDGDSLVCGSQYETYVLPTASTIYSYDWFTAEGNGQVTSLSPRNDSIEVYWINPVTTDTLVVEVTDNVSECQSRNYLEVSTRSEFAPARTTVVRKPHSNILVCLEESPSLYYSWGYTIKESGNEVLIEHSNQRYVQLPHDFDTTLYDYWVELQPKKDSPCNSRSYYNPDNDSEIVEPLEEKVSVPGLAQNVVPVYISNLDNKAVILEVFTVTGIPIFKKDLGKDSIITYWIDNLDPGALYLFRVVIGNEVFIRKTVVK